ncbi:MAG: hypothetical protein HYU64_12510 [Armatimonadetes bacterium]|nr:hypothetical protein [Armatimonadota bacterium]
MLIQEGQDPLLLLGFRNGPDYPNALSKRITGIRHRIATEDGSVGTQGLVTGLLPEEAGSDDAFIYACGPRPMLKVVEAIAEKRGLQGEVSLEERMACGIGVCKGCVTAIRNNEGRLYRRICTDGPTFPFGEVIYGD